MKDSNEETRVDVILNNRRMAFVQRFVGPREQRRVRIIDPLGVLETMTAQAHHEPVLDHQHCGFDLASPAGSKGVPKGAKVHSGAKRRGPCRCYAVRSHAANLTWFGVLG